LQNSVNQMDDRGLGHGDPRYSQARHQPQMPGGPRPIPQQHSMPPPTMPPPGADPNRPSGIILTYHILS